MVGIMAGAARARTVALGVALLAVAAACATDTSDTDAGRNPDPGDGGSERGNAHTEDPADGDPGRADGWVGLLAMLPDAPEARRDVRLNDHEAAAAARERIRGPDTDLDPRHPGSDTIAIGSELSGAHAGPDRADAWRDELGFDPADVAADATAGRPPEVYEVLRGRLDAAAVDDAVRRDPLWSDELEVTAHRDVTVYRWGDDHAQDLERTSPVRRIGQSARMALLDDVLLWATWTDGIEVMIDLAHGDGASLADDEQVASVVAAMEDAGAFSVVAGADPDAFHAGRRDTPIGADRPGGDREADDLVLDRFEVAGTGVGADDDGWFTVVVLAHEDGAAADANAERLDAVLRDGHNITGQHAWSDLMTDVEVATDGNLVVAVGRTDEARGLWTTVFEAPDLLWWR
jgi:hypothetical protein